MQKELPKSAKRIKMLRKRMGITQEELAEKLNDFNGTPDKIKKATISSWEIGHVPRVESMKLLAEFFSVTFEFISGRETEIDIKATDSLKRIIGNKPLKASELFMHNHTPVRLVTDEVTNKSEWGLVNAEKQMIIMADGSIIRFQNICVPVYVIPDAFTVSMTNISENPLSLNDAKNLGKADRVWIQAISQYKETRIAYKGWYKYSEDTDHFVSETSAALIPASGYGITFVAFKDII